MMERDMKASKIQRQFKREHGQMKTVRDTESKRQKEK